MLSKQLIDAHCHLDFDSFSADFDDVLSRAIDNNITDIIIPGTQKKYWQRITALTKSNPMLHPCYGLHPYWVNQHDRSDIIELESYVTTHNTIAIGECGLDFRKQQADKDLQLYFFEAQLEIAHTMNLPVVIHAVNATEAVIQCIKKFKDLHGMVHSYSGSLEQARQLIDLNFFISISGSVTYKNANKIRSVAQAIPLSSLLIETDAPDQPDEDNHGCRNEPAFLLHTLKKIAELRDESIDMIAQQTSRNTKTLFRL